MTSEVTEAPLWLVHAGAAMTMAAVLDHERIARQ